MFIYVLLLAVIFMFGLILIASPNSLRAKLWFLVLSFFACAIILGLRNPNVGEDTLNYINIFENSVDVSIKSILTAGSWKIPYAQESYGYTPSVEFGFLIWCKLIRLFSNNPQVFLFSSASFICFFFGKFIYDNCKNSDVFFPTLVFLCDFAFMTSFNLCREMMACSIAIQAYSQLKKRFFWRSIVTIIIAVTIHTSALAMLVLIPFMYLSSSKNQIVSFRINLLLAIIFPVLLLEMRNVVSNLFTDYSVYYNTGFLKESIGFSIIPMIIELLAVTYMYRKKFKIQESNTISILIISYIMFSILGINLGVFSRLGLYFRSFLILFYNKWFDYCRPRTKIVLKLAISILLILFYLSYAVSSSRTYSFFWD